MVFSDLFFLFVFIPVFVALYLGASLLDRKTSPESPKFRNAVLTIFSLIFYAWGEPAYIFLMLGTVFINYLAGNLIHKSANPKRALVIGLVLNLLILITFKYTGFICESLASIGIPLPKPEISLPIGISFYIFQSISYLVDVYRRQSEPQRKFQDLLLYISMFPQLIAGPIVRYNTVAQEIGSRHVSADDIADGVWRFMKGLGKKVIIANQLGEIAGQFLDADLQQLGTLGLMLGLLCFMMQIYFDFSGYSDMAIGIGRCLGFHFSENFNHPYTCSSVTDFWRRWHISLGTFFRDYVYIPMGGNRNHQWINILTVWFLTGMWHGASWNFIIWGMYFGLILIIEKIWLLDAFRKIPALGHVFSLVIVYLGWGIFYFDDFGRMCQFFRMLMGGSEFFSNFISTQAISSNIWLMLAAIALCLPTGKIARRYISDPGAVTILKAVISVVILFLSISLLVGATNNAFLYFRF